MKIIIGVHHFPPNYRGGAEQRALRTAHALQSRGYEVQAIAVEDIQSGPPNGVAWEDGVFEGVPVRRLRFNLSGAPDPFRWEYDNLWIGEHLETWLEEQQPDIFHLFSGYLLTGSALRIAQSMRIPCVLTLTDYWFLCRRISLLRSNGDISTLPIDPLRCARCLGEERRRFRWLGRVVPTLMDSYWRQQHQQVERFADRYQFLLETLSGVDAIISPSQFLRSVFVEVGVPATKIIFSRQGRDFPGLDLTVPEKTTSSDLRIGYIGQIAPHKGVHVLFDAMQLLPDARIKVYAYGDTDQFPSYAAQLRRICEKDARLTLAGPFDAHQISQVMRGLDVIVVPSLWYENSPNVILEAFAHRTPVIASDLGGMAELVRNGVDGLLFTHGDAASLAERLRRLLAEPDLLDAFQAGIEPVKSVKSEVDELEEVYRGVIPKNAPGSA